jgi:hypothetical protein
VGLLEWPSRSRWFGSGLCPRLLEDFWVFWGSLVPEFRLPAAGGKRTGALDGFFLGNFSNLHSLTMFFADICVHMVVTSLHRQKQCKHWSWPHTYSLAEKCVPLLWWQVVLLSDRDGWSKNNKDILFTYITIDKTHWHFIISALQVKTTIISKDRISSFQGIWWSVTINSPKANTSPGHEARCVANELHYCSMCKALGTHTHKTNSNNPHKFYSEFSDKTVIYGLWTYFLL